MLPPAVIIHGRPATPGALFSGWVTPTTNLLNVAPNVDPTVASQRTIGANWAVMCLPFIDQQVLYDKYNFRFGVAEPENLTVRQFNLQVFVCPADSFAGDAMSLYNGNFFRGDYAANAGASFGNSQTRGLVGINEYWDDRTLDQEVRTNNLDKSLLRQRRRGVMGFNGAISFGKVEDGAHRTAMVWEIRSHVSKDPRGVWSLGKIGSSIAGGCYLTGGIECNGINDDSPTGDRVADCVSDPTNARMNCTPGADLMASGRSQHSGGAHVLFCDNSVQFMTGSMDKTIGRAIETSNGEESFDFPK
jgi:prepilin-type processing-associated H-X9-DG protein